jgi:plasmid stabilization system protein ParE
MRRVRILAAASEDAAEAAAWYERERPGLGQEFWQAVETCLDLIEDELVPLMVVPGSAGARGAKRLVLRRFPYAIIVRERADEVIVIAVAHTSRRPGYWRDRA